MALRLLAFGGTIYDNQNVGSGTAVDIWSNTIALDSISNADPTQAECDAMAAIVKTWFASAGAAIAATASLEFVKLNRVDMVTGLQLTPQTMETVVNPQIRGASDNANPVTTCYRISLDDQTRNKRHRGGFYPPRAGLAVGAGGRWTPTQTTARVTAAVTMMTAINADANSNVVIWSRVNGSLTPATRIRVSDVPDNMSSRKNALLPTRVTGIFA